MSKKVCVISCFWLISACVTHNPMTVPNVEKIYHPDIAVYHINSGTKLDSLLNSEIQEDVPSDIHIVESTARNSNFAVIYLTEQGCVPSFFIDTPPLIGYCTYQTHSCFIYGVSEMINTSIKECLTLDLNRKISIDSVQLGTIFSSCFFKEVIFPY